MRHAFRFLRRSPGFSSLVVLTLALGIGATTAIFCVFRGVLLRRFPHDGGKQIVYLRHAAPRAVLEDVKFSVPEVIDLREGVRSLSGFAEFSAMPVTMLGEGRPTQVETGIVSGNYFEVVGLSPVLGRVLGPGDDGAAAEPVMVLTYGYWRRAFGSAARRGSGRAPARGPRAIRPRYSCRVPAIGTAVAGLDLATARSPSLRRAARSPRAWSARRSAPAGSRCR
jgi:hypothetical protein